MRSSRLSSRGTSLIEAMAALVVFCVGILGVMQMNVLASQQNNLARSQTIASKIARDVADSFERLPFDHPLINNVTSLMPNDPEILNMDNADGLVKLQDAVAQTAERPLLGAADAMFTSEGHSDFYQVAWRAMRVANPDRFNQEDQIRILVMVRFPAPGGGLKQVNTWAVKYDVRQMTGDPDTALEL
jgi:type IV pilus assembly protein PilV